LIRRRAETAIEKEDRPGRMNREIVEAAVAWRQTIVSRSKAVHALRRDIERWLGELEPLLKEQEAKRAEFDRKRAELEPAE
jgi:hypothetical protein